MLVVTQDVWAYVAQSRQGTFGRVDLTLKLGVVILKKLLSGPLFVQQASVLGRGWL